MKLELVRRWIYPLLFIAIFLLAGYLRLAEIYERSAWFDDTARDIIIAKKIVESGSLGTVRPFAAASQGRLNNSIVYYNFLAGLWSFGQTPLSVMIGFAVMGLLSLLAGWEIGRQIGGKWLGLLFLFLLSTNTTLVIHQLTVYQRNVLPSLALIIVMISLWVWRCPSLWRTTFLLVAFTISVLFHYGMLSLTPAVLGVALYAYWKSPQKLSRKVARAVLTFLCCFGMWLILTQSSIADVFFLLQPSIDTQDVGGMSVNSGVENFTATLQYFNNYMYLYKPMAVIWMIFLVVAAYLFIRRHVSAPSLLLFGFLFTYPISQLVFIMTKNYGLMDYHYNIQYLGLATLLIPTVVFELFKKITPQKIGYVILFTGLIYAGLELRQGVALPHTQLGEARESERIMKMILHDFDEVKRIQPQYQAFTLTDYTSWAQPGWFTPAFLFFLEEEKQQSFAELRADFNNLRYTFPHPAQVIYLVCHQWKEGYGFSRTVETAQRKCVDPFLNKLLINYTSAEPSTAEVSLLLSGEENAMGVNVFRVTLPATP